MTNLLPIIALGLILLLAQLSYARDDKFILPIAAALEMSDPEEKPEGTVKFFFGGDNAPAAVQRFRTYVADRRTGTYHKSDQKACNDAFMSALAALENRAQSVGANAVVNIVSYYKKVEMASATEFECHVGTVRAIVMLRGEFVKIAEK
jgi:uncharacterized protein YbjQ (UPF0145 family)